MNAGAPGTSRQADNAFGYALAMAAATGAPVRVAGQLMDQLAAPPRMTWWGSSPGTCRCHRRGREIVPAWRPKSSRSCVWLTPTRRSGGMNAWASPSSGNIASIPAALRSYRSRVAGRGSSCPSTEVRLFLSEHRGDARPDTPVGLTASDVDAVEAELGRPAGEPPYGCELELRDPDGNRLRIRRAAS